MRFRVSIWWRMIRSSSDLDRASPMDLIRSRNSFDWPLELIVVSSRPKVFSCSRFAGVWIIIINIKGFRVSVDQDLQMSCEEEEDAGFRETSVMHVAWGLSGGRFVKTKWFLDPTRPDPNWFRLD